MSLTGGADDVIFVAAFEVGNTQGFCNNTIEVNWGHLNALGGSREARLSKIKERGEGRSETGRMVGATFQGQ